MLEFLRVFNPLVWGLLWSPDDPVPVPPRNTGLPRVLDIAKKVVLVLDSSASDILFGPFLQMSKAVHVIPFSTLSELFEWLRIRGADVKHKVRNFASSYPLMLFSWRLYICGGGVMTLTTIILLP